MLFVGGTAASMLCWEIQHLVSIPFNNKTSLHPKRAVRKTFSWFWPGVAVQTHPETAAWRTRWPAARVWVWTGWGLGSKHLAEPVKAMRRSDRASAAAAQQYSARINISAISSTTWIMNQNFFFFSHLLPFKEEQTSVQHRKRPNPTKLLKEMETLSGKRAACRTAWRWHLKEN